MTAIPTAPLRLLQQDRTRIRIFDESSKRAVPRAGRSCKLLQAGEYRRKPSFEQCSLNLRDVPIKDKEWIGRVFIYREICYRRRVVIRAGL